MKIELGGGHNPRPGYVTVDVAGAPDVRCDLEARPLRLPFGDASVSEVYTSHTLEHVANYREVLREICRVCRVGAAVEIRVPFYASDMAMAYGHVQAIGPGQVRHWCEDFPHLWFASLPRRLGHVRTVYTPSHLFAEARPLFPHLTDEQVMKFVQGCCFDNHFHLRVIPNG